MGWVNYGPLGGGGGGDLVLIDKDTPLANSATLTVLDGVLVASGSRLAAKSIGSGVYQFGLVRTGGGSAIENIEAGIRVAGTASTARGINNYASSTAAIVANIRTGGGSMEFVARAWAGSINVSTGWMMYLARWGAMARQAVSNPSTQTISGTAAQMWASGPRMEYPSVLSATSGILSTKATTATVVAAMADTQYADRTVTVDIRRNGTSVATSSGGRRAYVAKWTGTTTDHDEFAAFGNTGGLSVVMATGGKFAFIEHDGRSVGTSAFTMTSQTVTQGGDTITSFTPTGTPPALHTGAQAIITGTGTATVTGKLTRSSATPTNQVDLLLNGTAVATQTWGASDSSEKTFTWSGSLTYGDVIEYRSTWTGSGTQTFTSGQLTITGS